jgi:hypothetical protein
MQYSSKELYMMNGGNKLYIYKDGFGDLYKATSAEELQWSQEIIENSLRRIDSSENAIDLKFAIDNLLFHHYADVVELLKSKLENTSPSRQIAFATALWKINQHEHSFEIVHQHFMVNEPKVLDNVFQALIEFKDDRKAREFVVRCLENENKRLSAKAHVTITMWAYGGLPELRANDLLEQIKPENKGYDSFPEALEQLKKILK